jgi:hypothetical protein
MNAGLFLNTKTIISPSRLGCFNLRERYKPYLGLKPVEFTSIKGLSWPICRHFSGGKIFNLETSLFSLLTKPAVVDIDVP